MADSKTPPIARAMSPFWRTRWDIGMMELYRDWNHPRNIANARMLYFVAPYSDKPGSWSLVKELAATIESLVREDNPDKAVEMVPVLSGQSSKQLFPELCDQGDNPVENIKEVLELMRRMFLCKKGETVRELDRMYIRKYIREDGLAKILQTIVGEVGELVPELGDSVEHAIVPAAIVALHETLAVGWDFRDSGSVGNVNYFILLVYSLHKMIKMTEWHTSINWLDYPPVYIDQNQQPRRVWGGSGPDGPSYTAYLHIDPIWNMVMFRELKKQMMHIYNYPPTSFL